LSKYQYMSGDHSSPLVEFYDSRIGRSSTADEAYGYLIFILGVVLGVVGIGLVLISGVESTSRGLGSMLAAVALMLLMIGPVIRLPLRKSATYLSYLGAVVCLAAVVWFFFAYPDEFGSAFDGQEVEIIALYGTGIILIAIGGIFTPLLVSDREAREEAQRRAAEAESRADRARERAADADTQRQAAEENAALAEAAERSAEADADAERAARVALADELARIRNSQSQFELYTDRGGKHRWRLRHRNGNIIADSAQGYSSRQNAQKGLAAVKRDALGAGVLDLDKTAVDVETGDEAATGEDGAPFLGDEEIQSQATFEVYEDAGGKYRWRLRHDNGNIIADSGQGYASQSSRDEGVERVRGYAQSADYLKLDPAAFEVYRDKGGKYRWRLLHRNGNILADSGQGYASRQKAGQGLDSVRRNAPEGGNAEFDIYEDAAGKYRWRLVHQNGNLIADGGEGYASKGGAESAVERIREYAPDAHVLDIGSAAFEIFEDAEGKWRWRLRHRNGRILADSGQGYTDRPGAEDGITSVKRNAPTAESEHV
jgi:uncharacterized protein YegP (UPF0339 family)